MNPVGTGVSGGGFVVYCLLSVSAAAQDGQMLEQKARQGQGGAAVEEDRAEAAVGQGGQTQRHGGHGIEHEAPGPARAVGEGGEAVQGQDRQHQGQHLHPEGSQDRIDGVLPVHQHQPHHQTHHRRQQHRAVKGSGLFAAASAAGRHGGEQKRPCGQRQRPQQQPLPPVRGGEQRHTGQALHPHTGGQVRQARRSDQKHARHRQGQQPGVGGGEARGKEGGVLRLVRQPPDQQRARRKDRRCQHRRGDAEGAAGDGQAGVRLEAGAPLGQPQGKGGAAAAQGQDGEHSISSHRRDLLVCWNFKGQYTTAGNICPCRSHVLPARRIQ